VEQGRQIAEVAELGDVGGVAGDDAGRVVVEPGCSTAGGRAGDCFGVATLADEREVAGPTEEAGGVEEEVPSKARSTNRSRWPARSP